MPWSGLTSKIDILAVEVMVCEFVFAKTNTIKDHIYTSQAFFWGTSRGWGFHLVRVSSQADISLAIFGSSFFNGHRGGVSHTERGTVTSPGRCDCNQCCGLTRFEDAFMFCPELLCFGQMYLRGRSVSFRELMNGNILLLLVSVFECNCLLLLM